MKPSKEYEQIKQNIHDIRKDVLKNKRRIEVGLDEMRAAEQKIPQTRAKVLSLKKTLKQLQEQNKNYYQSKMENIKYKEQANQLFQLASIIAEENKRYEHDPGQDDQSFSREKQLEIGLKIDDIINQINAEYTYSSEDYFQELKRLSKINASLDREIETLKLMKPEYVRYTDNFDIVLEDYSNKFHPEYRPEFKSFNTLNITPNDTKIEFQDVDTEVSYPPPLEISDLQNKVVDVIRDCKQKNKFVKNEYLIQHQELSKMIEALKDRPISFQNTSVIESCLQHRLQIMRAIGCVRPIRLPSQFSQNNLRIDPIKDVFAKFDSFFDDIKRCKENRNYNQPQLEIPPFKMPNLPRLIRKSTPSDELVKFSEDLNSIIEQTKQMIPIEWNNSITQTYRSLLNLKRYDITTPIGNLSLINNPPKTELNPDDYHIDKSSFDRFRETFSMKLPECLSKSLDNKLFFVNATADNQTVVVDPPNNENEEDSSFDIPVDFTQSFLNRIKTTNVILRELEKKTKTGVPHLQVPKPPEVTCPNINSNSLIENVRDVLSPQQQSICYLKNEIERLKASIEKLANQSIEKVEDEDEDDNSESLESMEDEIKQLNEDISAFHNEFNNCEKAMKNLNEIKIRIKNENDIIRQAIDANKITDEMVDQIASEYEAKKQSLKERIDAYEEFKELQSQLRAKS